MYARKHSREKILVGISAKFEGLSATTHARFKPSRCSASVLMRHIPTINYPRMMLRYERRDARLTTLALSATLEPPTKIPSPSQLGVNFIPSTGATRASCTTVSILEAKYLIIPTLAMGTCGADTVPRDAVRQVYDQRISTMEQLTGVPLSRGRTEQV